ACAYRPRGSQQHGKPLGCARYRGIQTHSKVSNNSKYSFLTLTHADDRVRQGPGGQDNINGVCIDR
ncbi:hypothetical protein H0H93_007167, partial [Arthromyces matolae]